MCEKFYRATQKMKTINSDHNNLIADISALIVGKAA
jgi:hypothetical protein